MLPDSKYFPVNWVDGMKIASRDFIALENAVFDGIRDVRAIHLNEYAYGLLPTNNPEVDNYPKLVYDYVNEVLVLKECRAVTPGGHRIEITEANHEREKYPAQLPSVGLSAQASGRFDVYIFVDPSVRVGSGKFAANNPPRYSAVAPKYELSVRPQDGVYIDQENFLKISELEVQGGRVDMLTNTGKYIPPCLTMHTLGSLRRLHEGGEERLKALLKHYTTFVNRMGAETPNEIALEALQLSEKLVTPIVSSLSHYQYILPLQPPVFTVAYFKDYARLVQFQLERPFRAKIINDSKSDLGELAARLEGTEPRHAAIQLSFDRIMQWLDGLDKFLAELTKYNYDRPYDVYDHQRFKPGEAKPQIPVKETPPEKPSLVSPVPEKNGKDRLY